MNSSTTSGSLIADRSIGTKVGLGFACVLVLLAVVSGTAYLSFQYFARGFETYVQRVSVVGIARDLDRGFLSLRRLAREYLDLGLESSVDAGTKELASLRLLLQRGMTEIKNPERHRLVEEVGRSVEAYAQSFNQIVEWRRERERLVKESLEPIAASLQHGFDALIAAAGKAGDGGVEMLGYKGRQQMMLTRVSVSKQLERNDQPSADATQASFVDLVAAIQALDTATKGTEFRKLYEDAQTGAAAYRDVAGKATGINRKMDDLANSVMRDMGGKVIADAESIKASGIAEEQQEERDTLSTMDWTSSLILYLSIGGLVLGGVLAWLIGRSISRPVIGMCAAMRALAGGDKTVDVPGVGRKDEVGQMADTVQVFKNNMIEAERLRTENEQQKSQAEAERKTGMLRIADTFEAGIKGVVSSVASQATEMQSAAQAMTHTAETATQQATAVSAAVEQASANVQTVATSAEELSASVLEIGRQVEQSSKIASQAVGEADRTNTTVEGLSHAAQRIGEVVQLIETIAGQTIC
jgi:HAMP domain-containing protein/uncharacterized protein YoxC